MATSSYMTPDQVAAELGGVPLLAVKRLIAKKILPASLFRVGKRLERRVEAKNLDAYIQKGCRDLQIPDVPNLQDDHWFVAAGIAYHATRFSEGITKAAEDQVLKTEDARARFTKARTDSIHIDLAVTPAIKAVVKSSPQSQFATPEQREAPPAYGDLRELAFCFAWRAAAKNLIRSIVANPNPEAPFSMGDSPLAVLYASPELFTRITNESRATVLQRYSAGFTTHYAFSQPISTGDSRIYHGRISYGLRWSSIAPGAIAQAF